MGEMPRNEEKVERTRCTADTESQASLHQNGECDRYPVQISHACKMAKRKQFHKFHSAGY